MKIIFLPKEDLDLFNLLIEDIKLEMFYNAQLKFVELISKYDNEELKLELQKIFNEVMHKRFINAHAQLLALISNFRLYREGWISILNSRKYHYCINGETVCRQFMYLGNDYQSVWNGKFTKEDCTKCIKFLQKREIKNAKI